MKNSNLAFCIWSLTLFAAFSLFSLLNWLFLVNTNDNRSAVDLAKRHLETGGLLGSIAHSVRDIKVPAYMEVMPDIVALGTSRSKQFRNYFFTKSFFNLAGGAINNQVRYEAELWDIDQTYFSKHKPSMVIMTLDYWAYTNALHVSRKALKNPHLIQPLGSVRLRHLYLPTYQVFANRIGVRDFFSFSTGSKQLDNPDIPLYGITAILNNRGMLRDGSHFTFRVPALDQRFAADLDGLLNSAFESTKDANKLAVNMALIDGLANAARDFGTKGIKTVFILAPVAPIKLLELAKSPDKYGYIDEIRQAFSSKLTHYYDMLDPRRFRSGDCEFEDGNHGGEVTYLRMLLAIDRHDKSVFNGYFDALQAKQLIAEHENLTVTAKSRVGEAYFKKFGRPVVAGCIVP